ncbi:MAG TPA: TonB-dependent receptor plug domain-containing protein, partial [Cellvibrio sp.]
EVIDRKKLDQLQPLSTQDALRKSPGIHAVDTEGYGFYPRITIRGLGSDMSKGVLLVEDGSPIALGPYTDPATYYSPPIERMDSIEVLKGSGALRYGPSTIGGAINYITRNPEKLLAAAWATTACWLNMAIAGIARLPASAPCAKKVMAGATCHLR